MAGKIDTVPALLNVTTTVNGEEVVVKEGLNDVLGQALLGKGACNPANWKKRFHHFIHESDLPLDSFDFPETIELHPRIGAHY